MKTIFASIPVGSRFEFNGNVCIKQSTRTAVLQQFGRVFYFGMKDRVRILGSV